MSSSNHDLLVTRPMSARQWAAQFADEAQELDPAEWLPPEFDDQSQAIAPEEDPKLQAELEQLREKARAEGLEAGRQAGFEQGYQAGMDAAAEDIKAQKARLTEWLSHLSAPLEQLDQEVNEQLIALATQIARIMIARELTVNRDGLRQIATEAMQAMPVATRELTLFCHPDDQPLMQELAESHPRLQITITADEQIQPGGLVVESGAAQVDAQLANRWADLIDNLIGRAYPGPHEPLSPVADSAQQSGQAQENAKQPTDESLASSQPEDQAKTQPPPDGETQKDQANRDEPPADSAGLKTTDQSSEPDQSASTDSVAADTGANNAADATEQPVADEVTDGDKTPENKTRTDKSGEDQ